MAIPNAVLPEPEAQPEAPGPPSQRPIVRLAWSLNGQGRFQVMFEGERAEIVDNTREQQPLSRIQNLSVTVPQDTSLATTPICVLNYSAEEEILVAACTTSSQKLLVVNQFDIQVKGHDDGGRESVAQGTTTTVAKGLGKGQ